MAEALRNAQRRIVVRHSTAFLEQRTREKTEKNLLQLNHDKNNTRAKYPKTSSRP